jgi:hypothetical protein
MQNEDKKWRGLEEKLRRLQPREIEESSFRKLLACFEKDQVEAGGQQGEGGYPSNVLWMRFAPVAAAAGVVLLGTFFLRYESRMDTLQAQRNDAHSAVGGRGASGDIADATVSGPMSGLMPESSLAGLGASPVPRLGMGGGYGAGNHPPDLNLLPVSAQDYLQPVDGLGIQESAPLRFEDAYLWREGLGSDPGSGKEKPEAKTQ